MIIQVSKCIFLLVVAFALAMQEGVYAQDRGKRANTTQVQPQAPRAAGLKTGKNIALVIGTDKFRDPYWKPLGNPVLDARKVAGILETQYNYEVVLLENPPKDTIFSRLLSLRNAFNKNEYGSNTNLFIFIAGHGSYDDFSKGYLVPADAKNPDADVSKSSYIEYSVIKDKINEINATHILLALDVCNGGTFDAIKVNSTNDLAACRLLAEGEYQKLTMSQLITKSASCKSRKFIASGGNESVSDGNSGDHSPFAKEFIQSLNKGHYNKRVVTFAHLCYNISDITTSKPVFSDFSGESTGSDYLFIPNSIVLDGPLKNHFNPPPAVQGYSDKSTKILIMPRQGGSISVAEMLDDPAMRAAIAYLNDLFQNNGVTPVYFDFVTAGNVKDDKQQIVKKAGADVYIEVDLKPGNDGTGANNVSVTLTCVNATSGKLKYTKTYRGDYFFTEDYEALTEQALEEHTDEILSLTIK